MRFTDFLRTAVLLFGGAATALAVVALAGTRGQETNAVLYLAVGWWVVAALAGLWLGRRMGATPGISRLLAGAKSTSTLPEVEPGAVIFNRLWPLAVATVGSGGVAFLLPQVPAIAAGYALVVALSWRRQAAAVQAIEDRDGVRFWFDRSSPFGPPRLLRTPWARKVEPLPDTEREPARAR